MTVNGLRCSLLDLDGIAKIDSVGGVCTLVQRSDLDN